MPHINRGQRYVIVFMDHFSRFRRGFFLNKKNNSAEALDRFVNFATSVGVRVKCLHRDRAGEFLDTDKIMKPVLVKHNILGATSTSAAGIHRQNSVAERNNRTLQDGICMRLIQANLYCCSGAAGTVSEDCSPARGWGSCPVICWP